MQLLALGLLFSLGAYSPKGAHCNCRNWCYCDTGRDIYWYRVGHASLSNSFGKTQTYLKSIKGTRMQMEAAQANDLCDGLEDCFTYRVIYATLLAVVVSARNGDKDAYLQCRKSLQEMQWKKNPYTKKILTCNYGKLKTFVLMHIIPISYPVAHLVTNAVM